LNRYGREGPKTSLGVKQKEEKQVGLLAAGEASEIASSSAACLAVRADFDVSSPRDKKGIKTSNLLGGVSQKSVRLVRPHILLALHCIVVGMGNYLLL
jgi:hypothetical protein